MSSLSGRLLLFVSLLLVVFFGLTIFALDFSFRDLSERSLRELLEAQLMGLVAGSDADENGRVQPSRPLEQRFSRPGSGLYAQIRTASGELLWESQSALGMNIDFGGPVAAGQKRQERRDIVPDQPDAADSQVMVLSAGYIWEIQPGSERDLVFSVATSLAPYEAQLQRFRNQLFGWFSALMALLLVALALLLRRVLSPLRRLEREIGEVEGGGREELGTADLPSELMGVANNMNTLLASERKRAERYRNTLGNLAHSLKTPLAVVRATLSGQSDAGAREKTINQQIDRMDTIVQHQLKRASASGGAIIGRTAVEVRPLLMELRTTLSKVYARKDLSIEIDAADGTVFFGDRGDWFELAGNLMDNACKWCRERVRVTVKRTDESKRRPQLLFSVEDDGPGTAVGDRDRILERGARADQRKEGQGIGLAMVREVVELYGGDIEIGESQWGGARVGVRLPGR